MKIDTSKPISSEAEYKAAIIEIDRLWNVASIDVKVQAYLEQIAKLVHDYERAL